MEVNAHHTEKLLKEINRALLPCQYQSDYPYKTILTIVRITRGINFSLGKCHIDSAVEILLIIVKLLLSLLLFARTKWISKMVQKSRQVWVKNRVGASCPC